MKYWQFLVSAPLEAVVDQDRALESHDERAQVAADLHHFLARAQKVGRVEEVRREQVQRDHRRAEALQNLELDQAQEVPLRSEQLLHEDVPRHNAVLVLDFA